MSYKVVTVRLPEMLYRTIAARAKHNLRNITAEVNYLLECGLAERSDVTREFMRVILMQQPSIEGNDAAANDRPVGSNLSS
jgi:hypothetical protein